MTELPAQPADSTLYLAAEGFVAELAEELGEHEVVAERLLEAPGPERPAAWAQNVWLEPRELAVRSIADAARQLKSVQRNWALYPTRLHRRAALVVDALPKVSARPLVFPEPAPVAPLGSWALLDEHTVVASAACTSPFPNGEARFVEDRHAPPNRAYLKLWEALTLARAYPRPGERCLDLGASPGGWTWVLATLGAQVLAMDRAELEPRIAALANVTFEKHNAFSVEPAKVGDVDWLCCDVISYPEKTYELVSRWLDSGRARRIVCSVKFQGQTDMAIVRKFQALPSSRLRHLFHNKHELTLTVTTP
jgi:23S rRNA (cytidine2498-2'-O)-methyltransferase